jgi:hypothetical protein
MIAGKQHLGLVRDREVGLARREQLQRRGRVGWHLQVDIEPGAFEVAPALRGVEADVVGVGQVVEHDGQLLLARRADVLLLLAAARGNERGREDRDQDGRQLSHAFLRFVRGAHGTARRSASVSAPNSSRARAESSTTAA